MSNEQNIATESLPVKGLVLDRSDPFKIAQAFVRFRLRKREASLIFYRNGFYTWGGRCYREVEDSWLRSRVYRFLDGAVVHIRVGNETVEERFKPDDRIVNKVIDALKSRPEVWISSDLQSPCWLPGASEEQRAHDPAVLFVVANGVVDLKTGDLLAHSSELLTMNAVDYDFDPTATCPRWHRFLSEVQPSDLQVQQMLAEMFGYMLTPDTSQQKIFALIGVRRSGKGTIARVLEALLGGTANVAHPTMDALRERFGLWNLIDKKAAVVGDARLDGKTLTVVERLLSMSGEDGIDIDRKHAKPWTGKLGVRFLILSNELPGFSDESGTIPTRFILGHFRQSFAGNEDPGLTETLLRERSGILNWAIAGLRRLRDRGHFVQPDSSGEIIELMKHIANPLIKFVRDRCILDPTGECCVSEEMLADAVKQWREENGHSGRFSKTGLHKSLLAIAPYIKLRRPGERGAQFYKYFGIKLRKLGTEPSEKVVPIRSGMASGIADIA